MDIDTLLTPLFIYWMLLILLLAWMLIFAILAFRPEAKKQTRTDFTAFQHLQGSPTAPRLQVVTAITQPMPVVRAPMTPQTES